MKTKILIAALVSGLVIAAGAGQAQQHQERPDFATLDINSDGALTMEELQTQGEARFVAADTDGDGGLSAQELTAAANAGAQGRTARMLERLDANDDGVLQQSEMRPRDGAGLARMFENIDADDDGTVTEAEFEAAKERRDERRGNRDRG